MSLATAECSRTDRSLPESWGSRHLRPPETRSTSSQHLVHIGAGLTVVSTRGQDGDAAQAELHDLGGESVHQVGAGLALKHTVSDGSANSQRQQQSVPIVSANSQRQQSVVTVGGNSQCQQQSVPTVSAESQCRESVPTVSANSQWRQSVPTVGANSQCQQPVPTVSANSQCQQSVPRVSADSRCR